jgi:hypothetical protein
MSTAAVAFGSALFGASTAFFGAWFLASRSDARHDRAAVNSIVYEMSLLASSLSLAAGTMTATSPAFKPLFWRNLAPNLANCLPADLVKALYLQFHELDQANFGYQKLMGGVDAETRRAISYTLFCWAFNADELGNRIVAWRRLQPWHPTWWTSRAVRLQKDRLDETLASIKSAVIPRLRAAGFETDDAGNLVNGAVKTRWEPRGQ